MIENNLKWNIVDWIETELMMMFFHNALFNEIDVRDGRL